MGGHWETTAKKWVLGGGLVSMLVLEDDTFGPLWVPVDVGLPSGLVASAPKWNPQIARLQSSESESLKGD